MHACRSTLEDPTGRAVPREDIGRFSPEFARRLDRVGAKIERKLDQLDRKHGRRGRPGGAASQGAVDVHSSKTLKRRWLLGLLVLLGFSVVLGVVAGLAADRGTEEAVASSILGVLAMTGGIMGARKAQHALGETAQPSWVRGLITIGCAGPLIAISMAPAVSHQAFNPGLILGLIGLVVFTDWEKRIQSGVAGELKAGQAFSAGLGALILTAIFSQGDEDSMFLAAGVAATVSLAVQGLSWFIPPKRIGASALADRARRRGGPPPPPAPMSPGPGGTLGVGAGPVEIWRAQTAQGKTEPGSSGHPGAFGLGSLPLADAREGRHSGRDPLERRAISRAFWSVVTFGLLTGVVVASLSAGLLRNLNTSDRHATLVLMVIAFALLTFAARKVRLRKQPTFWRETLRPFLMSLSLIGIGVPIVCMALLGHIPDRRARVEAWATVEAPPPPPTSHSEQEIQAFESRVFEYEMQVQRADRMRHAMNDEEFVAAISVLVVSSLLYLILLFARGRKSPSRAFILPGSGGSLGLAGPVPAEVTAGEPAAEPVGRMA